MKNGIILQTLEFQHFVKFMSKFSCDKVTQKWYLTKVEFALVSNAQYKYGIAIL